MHGPYNTKINISNPSCRRPYTFLSIESNSLVASSISKQPNFFKKYRKSTTHIFCGLTIQLGPRSTYCCGSQRIRHTNPVRLLWMRDQLVAGAVTYAIHNKKRDEKSMPSAGFEPAVPAIERPQTYTLGHMTTRIDQFLTYYSKSFSCGRNLGADVLVHQVTTNINYETSLNNIRGLQPTEFFPTMYAWGTRWRSWIRHWATTRKVAGAIPDDVDIFYLHTPSDPSMALGETQPPVTLRVFFGSVSSPLCVWELESVCSQTQLCQLTCLMIMLDNYM